MLFTIKSSPGASIFFKWWACVVKSTARRKLLKCQLCLILQVRLHKTTHTCSIVL